MRFAVEGCCHGELDKIYDTVIELQNQQGFKIDLLIICGDFQAVRNFDDLQAMAVPQKYQKLNTFYKYYSGEKIAPVLTIFIGGNHEASNYLQELPYGGWVAPNIYYMGYAGIIQVGGVRIGGISGIYKGHDFNKGHFERPPYGQDTVRSVYHVRNLEVFRLKQISRHTDIFLSHDWPRGIYHNGDKDTLLKRKPFFRQEIEENKLGAQPLSDLLQHLQPSYWFAAHLHVKFAAHVDHQPGAGVGRESAKTTRFLALDKCLPHRHFLQVLEIPHKEEEGLKIKLDPEWLSILKSTDHLLKLTPGSVYMPGPGGGERYNFTVSDTELKETVDTFGGDMSLPENFEPTSPPIIGQPNQQMQRAGRCPLTVQVNPQTTLLCTMLEITDPNAKLLGKTSQQILEGSSVASPGRRLSSSSDDAVVEEEDEDSNREMPSTIDSSLDISVTSSTSQRDMSGWESFHTAHESLNGSRLNEPSSSSTPLKIDKAGGVGSCISPLVLPAPSVADDDEEFLSILSAQKRKSFKAPADTTEKHLPSPTPTHDKCASSTTTPNSHLIHTEHDGSQPKAFADDEPSSSSPLPHRSASYLEQPRTSPGAITNSSSPSTSSSVCDSSLGKPLLKCERSSLGMSGLQLSSDVSSSPSSLQSPSMKRSSPNGQGEGDADSSSNQTNLSSSMTATVESSPSLKKFKRRNVSVYSEPSE